MIFTLLLLFLILMAGKIGHLDDGTNHLYHEKYGNNYST